MKTGKVYFRNLNTIRFIASFMVVFHHIEQFKLLYDLPNNFDHSSSFYLMGKLGVVMFFVLSGFLITFLLLKEEEVTGTIKIKDFYVRRILKIWPLYFLIFIIGLYILPNIPFLTIDGFSAGVVQENIWFRTFLFVFFLPNLMMIASSTGNGFIPGANQLWSIGTEEQFYLFWPVLFKNIKVRRFTTMFVVIIAYLGLGYIVVHMTPSTVQKHLVTFLGFFNIDCMAIGGISAMIYYHKKTAILNIIYNRYLQWALLLGTVFCIYKGYYFSQGYYTEIYALPFAAIILNFATNPKPILNLESKWSNYLGKISYGIYMYHCIAAMIVISVLRHYNLAGNPAIYIGTVILTLVFASLSYHYFEERFIRLKVRFSKIVSGDNAKEQVDVKPETPVNVAVREAPGV